jgi:two-component system nitrate/nitrite response regulator NarL
MITILLVDDHAITRSGLKMLLESQPNLQLVGEASNHEEAVRLARQGCPDIILLDQNHDRISNLHFIQDLNQTDSKARVVILTGIKDPEELQQAVRMGAMGVIHKDNEPNTLFTALEKVNAGEAWIHRSIMARVLQEASRPPAEDPEAEKIAALTDREREVIALLCRGHKNQEIAERLFVQEGTVSHHLSTIFGKLELTNRLELVIYAFQNHLV